MKTVMCNEYMLKMLRLAGMGLLLWILPSAASLGLYDRSGRLNVSFQLFSRVIVMVFLSFGSCFPFLDGRPVGSISSGGDAYRV